MPGKALTTNSQIMCPHGGQATLSTANTKASAVQGKVLLESDVHTVAGCAFTRPGPQPSPCVTIEWSAGASKVKINGTAILIESSTGTCKSGEGTPQGKAMISTTQQKVSAT